MSSKYNTLFVFEGSSTEDNIVGKLEKYFMDEHIAIKCVYGGDIYQLYRSLQKEDFAVDILSILKIRSESNRIQLEGYNNDSFAYIYFFFDYDAHATMASDNQIEEMLSYFDNETENGKMFISYPMVEAIRHYKDKESFMDLKVKCKKRNCPNSEGCEDKEKCFTEPHYKTFVPTDNLPCYTQLNTFEIWKELIEAHLCKSNYIVNDECAMPTEIIAQSLVFKNQCSKFVSQHCPIIAVLSAFPLFVQDYYGVEGLNNKLSR